MVKQAFILGAGFGSRMRPLTDKIPKPLVPLAGKPLIDHVISRLTNVGVEKIVVNVHYLADQLEEHLRKNKQCEIIISDEREHLLDTGGGAKKALQHFGSDPFFIHNSDSVWIEDGQNNLQNLLNAFDNTRMDNILCLANRHTCLGYDGKGDFILNDNGLIERKPKETDTDYVFIGASIATPALFNNAPEGAFSLNKLWDTAIRNERLYGIKHQGLWMHVGTTEALSEAEDCIKKAAATK